MILKNYLKRVMPSLSSVVFVLAWFAIAPLLRAVVPAPDGGYPGGNTAEGQNALLSLMSGRFNTAVGLHSLGSNTDGSFNTATGAGALLFSTSDQNTAFGAAALLFNTFGFGNTAVGAAALLSNTGASVDTPNGGPGSGNTAVGVSALSSNTTGAFNTAVGANALANSLGLGNIALGSGAGSNVTTANSVTCIGAVGANVDNSCYIARIFGAGVSGGSVAVFVDSDGKLGTNVSSRRFEQHIEPMEKASEAILALNPVTFHYRSDETNTAQFGLIAEEVAQVNPDLVVRDDKGEIYTVRYEAVNAMLLNEFLKEHKKTEKLEATVASLIATVKEQAAQIQKVSAQLEASKTAPQVVNNQ